jgi:hypothetical protein
MPEKNEIDSNTRIHTAALVELETELSSLTQAFYLNAAF